MNSDYELIRRCAIVIKHSIKHRNIGFFQGLSFVFRFLFNSSISTKPAVVRFSATRWKNVYLRTKTSDFEVFLQHFIYGELDDVDLSQLNDIRNIVDGGANIGLTSLIFSELFPQSRIFAIEPDESNFEMLQKNCRNLIDQGIVIPLQRALHPTKTKLYLDKKNLEHWSFRITSKGDETNMVEAITWDEICSLCGENPDLVKMDIEGSELEFFRVEREFLKILKHSVLLIELHGYQTHLEFFNLMKRMNISQGTKLGEFWMIRQNVIRN